MKGTLTAGCLPTVGLLAGQLVLDLFGGRNSVRVEPSRRIGVGRRGFLHPEQVHAADQHGRRWIPLPRVTGWQRVEIHNRVGVRQSGRFNCGFRADAHQFRLHAPATRQELNRLGHWGTAGDQGRDHADDQRWQPHGRILLLRWHLWADVDNDLLASGRIHRLLVDFLFVDKAHRTQEKLVVKPHVTIHGDCIFEVNGQPLEAWQVSKMAVEGFFFEFGLSPNPIKK